MTNAWKICDLAVYGLVAFTLSACGGTSTKVSKTLHDPDSSGQRYSNVLLNGAQ